VTRLVNPAFATASLTAFFNQGFIHVVTALFLCLGIDPPFSLMRNPLPTSFHGYRQRRSLSLPHIHEKI
jgi:hypothetical protein